MTFIRTYRWLLLLMLLSAVLMFLLSSSGFKWVYHHWIEDQLAPMQIKGLDGYWWGPVHAEQIDIVTDTQSLTLNKVEIDWSPWSLLSGVVDITDVQVHKVRYHSLATSAQSGTTTIQALPISLNVRHIAIKQLELARPDADSLSITDLLVSAKSRGERVNIDGFSGSVNNIKYQGEGTLDLNEKLDMNLSAQWNTTHEGQYFAANATAIGNRDELLISHYLQKPTTVIVNLTLYHWLDELRWQGNIKADKFNSDVISGHQFPFKGNLSLQASGDLNKATGVIQALGVSPDFGEIELSSEFAANEQHVSWNRLTLVTKPDNATILSTGVLTIKEHLKLDAELQWQNLKYIKEQKPLFKSTQGSVELAGDLDSLSWNASFDTSADNLPATEWVAEGRYEHKQQMLSVKNLLIKSLDGRIQANGDISLSRNLPWKLSYHGNNINPGKFWSEWPGKLRFKGEANGVLTDSPAATVTIQSLDGVLRKKQVNAHARMVLKNNRIVDADMSLKSGRARMILNGKYDVNPDFKWSLNAPAIGDLLPGAKGQVKLDGSIQGALAAPTLRVQGFARSLSLGGVSADNIQINVSLPSDSQAKGDINLQAKKLLWQQQQWDSISLRANGDYQNHLMKLDARQAANQFIATVEGNWNKPHWEGTLASMSWLQKDMSPWHLSKPSKITVATNRIALTSSCLSNQTESACVDLDYQGQGTNKGSIQLKNLSLDHLNTWLPAHVRIKGSLEGDMRWRLKDNIWQQFHSNVQVLPGEVTLPGSDADTGQSNLSWQFTGGHLGGEIRQSNIKLNWRLDQANNTGLSGHLILPVSQLIDKGGSSRLDAGLKANIDDLKIIEAFFPGLYQLQGIIFADLNISGSWDAPHITGQAGLKNTRFQWPQLGLAISELELDFQPLDAQQYALTASARSDKGHIKASGKLEWPIKTGFRLTTALTGDSFKVVNVPEAQIWVNPKLDIEMQPGHVKLNGAVYIPKAFIQPKNVKQTVSISKDVVVTGLKKQSEPAWQISSQIKLSLGPGVMFDGFGLKSQIGGEIQIVDTPNTVTLAQGKLSIVKGIYKAYGQELSIANGDLNYTNNPIDNPALDIRAFRTIEDVQAGIHITGLAQEPQLNLYSKPAMPEADILSYLTIGRPVQQLNETEGQQLANTAATSAGLAGGEYLANWVSQQLGFKQLEFSTETREQQPWVRVGAYLSPRLYISYGTGLFDEGSSLSIRYKLNKNWTLQGESGIHSSGDLLYIIE